MWPEGYIPVPADEFRHLVFCEDAVRDLRQFMKDHEAINRDAVAFLLRHLPEEKRAADGKDG